MATEENDEAPQKDRATVALVAEKVDGLKSLTEAGFESVQRQLDRVTGLPERFESLLGKHDALDKRVATLEREGERSEEWRRGPLLVVIVGILVAIVNLLPQILH